MHGFGAHLISEQDGLVEAQIVSVHSYDLCLRRWSCGTIGGALDPEACMSQEALDGLGILDECDGFHLVAALRADRRVLLEDLGDELRPGLPRE